MANFYIGKFANLGDDCVIHLGVNIGDFVIIKNRCILHHGASIGADGFSFVTETTDNIETARKEGSITGGKENQKVYKIPSLGSVLIEDDVEIDANTEIDRGNIENNTIG